MSDTPELAEIPEVSSESQPVRNKPPKWLFVLIGGCAIIFAVAIVFLTHLSTHISIPELAAPPLPVGLASPTSSKATTAVAQGTPVVPRTLNDEAPKSVSPQSPGESAAPAVVVQAHSRSVAEPIKSGVTTAIEKQIDQLKRDVESLKSAPLGQGSDNLGKSLSTLKHQLDLLSSQISRQDKLIDTLRTSVSSMGALVRRNKRDIVAVQVVRERKRRSDQVLAEKPPFRLVSTESWGGEPNAVVNWDGRLAALRVRDIRAGWTLRGVSIRDESAEFIQLSTGRRFTLHVGG